MTAETLLRNAEGKTLEFRRDLSAPQGILRTLVAFANSAGGSLVFGMDGRDVVGVPDPLALAEGLEQLAGTVEPPVLPEIEIVPWGGTHLVVARVHPSAQRPHRLEGTAYVRLGTMNRLAEAEIVASPATDARPLPEEPAGKVILFGQHRLQLFPDAWIQVARFSGTDSIQFRDRAELRQGPIEAIEEAIRFVERNSRTGVETERNWRRDPPPVPPMALREAVINAVLHADYGQRAGPIRVAVFDDRVEVENPGILLPGLTLDRITQGVSRVRNRVIARVFEERGLVDRWGTGIPRMIAACREAGLPPPEFAEVAFRFRVTLHAERGTPAVVESVDGRILQFLSEEGRSTAQIASHIGLTPRATQYRLGRLALRGLVVAIGSGPKDPRRKWFRIGRS